MAQTYNARRRNIIREEVLLRWVGCKLGKAVKSLSKFKDGCLLQSLVTKISGGEFDGYLERKANKPMTTVKKLFETKRKGSDILIDKAQERVHYVLKYLDKLIVLPMSMQSIEMAVLSGSVDILELLESLVLHFDIRQVLKCPEDAKKALLRWVNEKLPDKLQSHNFGDDWRDGLRLAAFINHYNRDWCPDWQSWDHENSFLNLKTAMDVAADEVQGVTPLLGPADMSFEGTPDICVITYLSQFLTTTCQQTRMQRLPSVSTLSEQYKQEAKEMYAPLGPPPVYGTVVVSSDTSDVPNTKPLSESPDSSELYYEIPADIPDDISTVRQWQADEDSGDHDAGNDDYSSDAYLEIPADIPDDTSTVRQRQAGEDSGDHTGNDNCSRTQGQTEKKSTTTFLDANLGKGAARQESSENKPAISRANRRKSGYMNWPPDDIVECKPKPRPKLPVPEEKIESVSSKDKERATEVPQPAKRHSIAKIIEDEKPPDEYSYTSLPEEMHPDETYSIRSPENIKMPKSISMKYPETTVGIVERIEKSDESEESRQRWKSDSEWLLGKYPELDRIVLQALRPPNALELGTQEEANHGNVADIYQARLYDQEIGLCMVAAKATKDTNDEIHLLKEAALMMKLRHENVMCLYGLVLIDERVYMLQPWMVNGDLKKYLENRGPNLKEQRLLVFALDIACAMEYLAERNIVHRDLAARNCLLDRVLRVKISDFTLSRDVFIEPYVKKSDMGMPYQTAALEVLEALKYTTMSDVWSFGVLLWEIFTLGAEPYFNMMSSQVTLFLAKGNRLAKPDNDKHDMHKLMLQCWQENPKERPTFSQIFEELEKVMTDINPSYTSRMAMPTASITHLKFQVPEMRAVRTYSTTDAYFSLDDIAP